MQRCCTDTGFGSGSECKMDIGKGALCGNQIELREPSKCSKNQRQSRESHPGKSLPSFSVLKPKHIRQVLLKFIACEIKNIENSFQWTVESVPGTDSFCSIQKSTSTSISIPTTTASLELTPKTDAKKICLLFCQARRRFFAENICRV
ncbi:hypothetical protein SDJN03_06763, partial [Cucurbita argyrosperma subsp. sororia]